MPATKVHPNEWRIPTDEEHLLKVDSFLISADWQKSGAFAGQEAPFIIMTAFVGHGANAKIKGMSERGLDLGEIEAKVLNDQVCGSFRIPPVIESGDQIYFSVTFDLDVIYPPNNAGGFSSTIPVFPMPQVPSLSWSKRRVNGGEEVGLDVSFIDVPDGTSVDLLIYRIIETGSYDNITRLFTTVEGGRVQKSWKSGQELNHQHILTKAEAHTLNVEHQTPQYIFTVRVGDKEYGKEDEASNRLEVFTKPVYRFSV